MVLGLAIFIGCQSSPPSLPRLPVTDLGRVLLHGDSFDILGARDAYIFSANDTFYLYYDAAGVEGWISAVAVSNDLRHWEKKGPILAMGDSMDADSKSASYSVVTPSDSGYFMLYLATQNTWNRVWKIPTNPYRICTATAPHPLGPWTQTREPVLPLGESGAFDELSTAPSFLMEYDGKYLMYYSAAGKKAGSYLIHRTIGVAVAASLGGPWEKTGAPLLPPDEQIENASLYHDTKSGTWYLFTNHIAVIEPKVKSEVVVGKNRPVEYTDAIYVYWSDDPLKWDFHNKAVVLDSSNVSWDTAIIGLPSVIAKDDTLWIFYDGKLGSDEFVGFHDGSDHMHRDVGVGWVKLPFSINK